MEALDFKSRNTTMNFVMVNDRDEEKILCPDCLQDHDFEECNDEERLFVVDTCSALPCEFCDQELIW